MIQKKILTFTVIGFFAFVRLGFAAANAAIMDMSLEDLMSIKITSISKTPQNLAKTPAAVYVITNDEIKRSGATTIPDLLRGVPGVQVGRVDASTWAVSIRGFQDRFANKLLVLMDGRSVYTPLFSGTFWSLQDTLFEDIDRIEVVRGPGGTSWGANAVNGVINIITKSSKETQGGYVAGGYGSKENGFGDVRYGGKVGDKLTYRVYNKYYNRDKSFLGEDDWEAGKAGGRIDWSVDPQNLVTVQGDYYALYGYTGNTIRHSIPPVNFGPQAFFGPYTSIGDEDTKARGRNVLGRWTHTVSEDSDLSVQAYYDFTYLGNPFVGEARDTYDVDARYRFPLDWGVSQEIIIGGGYRYTADQTNGTYEVSFVPADRTLETLTGSVQDEIRLIKDFMTVWVGSKFEHNDFTGFEVQPSVRAAIYPDNKNTVWGSITRAVRTPSRASDDLDLNIVQQASPNTAFPTPLEISVLGGDDLDSEVEFAYEAGLKSQITESINADIAAFYNEYDGIITTAYGSTSTVSGVTRLPLTWGNNRDAETYGAEGSLKYFLTDKIRLSGSYSYLKIRVHPDSSVNLGAEPRGTEDESPNHQATGGLSLDLPWNVTFDSEVRYVSDLSALSIGSYVVADIRVGWKPKPDIEISVVGQNLFDAKHFEFKTPNGLDFLGVERRISPSYYVKVEAKF